MGDLSRALAFLRAIDERASSYVEPFSLGTAYLRPELPQVWSRNYLLVDAKIGEQQLETLASEADRLHASAGLEHRRLVLTDQGSGSLAAGMLASSGWRVRAETVMVHRGRLKDPSQAVGVREVKADALRAASDEAARENPDVQGELTVEQLQTAYELVGAATHERCFAAEVDGAIASLCRLYSDGETAQIEDVSTLSAFRNRGLAGAVVSQALAAATRSHSMTFLLAADDDWPKSWYERIGFQPIGLMWDALKT